MNHWCYHTSMPLMILQLTGSKRGAWIMFSRVTRWCECKIQLILLKYINFTFCKQTSVQRYTDICHGLIRMEMVAKQCLAHMKIKVDGEGAEEDSPNRTEPVHKILTVSRLSWLWFQLTHSTRICLKCVSSDHLCLNFSFLSNMQITM